MYCYLEFKLRCLKTLIAFNYNSSRGKGDEFLLFKNIFLRYLSFSNSIGNFTVKNANLEGELSRKKCGVCLCHLCAKGFFYDSNFNKRLLAKVSIIHEIGSNFTYSQKIII